MKPIAVNNKTHIKQLLYSDCVLGIADSSCQAFGGFQLWWYDRQHDTCHCCQSRWSDLRKHMEQCSLDKAARILWHKRRALFLRGRHLSEDKKLSRLNQCCN